MALAVEMRSSERLVLGGSSEGHHCTQNAASRHHVAAKPILTPGAWRPFVTSGTAKTHADAEQRGQTHDRQFVRVNDRQRISGRGHPTHLVRGDG